MNNLKELINPNHLIKEGDIVYVVSDVLEYVKFLRNNKYNTDLNLLIDAISSEVGVNGTVLFPTFNWDFCKGVGFDYFSTPSQTGALTKVALQREDFMRTMHPIYSFAVKGKKQAELVSIDIKESFGIGTVFDYLYQQHGKALVIGLPALAGLSFIHHIEKVVGVPYRYEKEFTAEYRDNMHELGVRTYSMYVRDLDMNPVPIDLFQPIADEMEALGAIRTWKWGPVEAHFVDLRMMFDIVKTDILDNDSRKMYSYRDSNCK